MEENKCNKEEKNYGDNIVFDSCEIYKDKEFSSYIDDDGRILVVNVKIKNVICGSKIAVGVIIYKDNYIKALKVREITVGCLENCQSCVDVNVGKFIFAIPEGNLCCKSDYKVEVISNYTSLKQS